MKKTATKKNIGTPKYKAGDKVRTSFTKNDTITIKNSFHNGFTWMYYFEESYMGCGEQYITPIKEESNEPEELFTKGEWKVLKSRDWYYINSHSNVCKISIPDWYAERDMIDKQAEANARLIAASKDMYYALQVLANLDLEGVKGDVVYQRNKSKILVSDVMKAREAIKKVTSKPT